MSPAPSESDEEIVARLVGFRVYVADGRESPTYDLNPAIVIEHTAEQEAITGPYRMELQSFEVWALVRLLLLALEDR